MFTRNLSTSCEVLTVMPNTAITRALATYAPAAIDTQGYQSVMLILSCPNLAAANTPVLSCNYGTNTTTNTVIANSTVAVGLNTNCQVLELARPSQRYITPVVTGGSGNGTAANTTVSVVAVLAGRDPQQLGNGAPLDNMIPQNSSFNTTTGVFGGVANLISSANTPTSKVLLANP